MTRAPLVLALRLRLASSASARSLNSRLPTQLPALNV